MSGGGVGADGGEAAQAVVGDGEARVGEGGARGGVLRELRRGGPRGALLGARQRGVLYMEVKNSRVRWRKRPPRMSPGLLSAPASSVPPLGVRRATELRLAAPEGSTTHRAALWWAGLTHGGIPGYL